jgi:hypothetical protein
LHSTPSANVAASARRSRSTTSTTTRVTTGRPTSPPGVRLATARRRDAGASSSAPGAPAKGGKPGKPSTVENLESEVRVHLSTTGRLTVSEAGDVADLIAALKAKRPKQS